MLPNFLIIGAPRCGTTWMDENLRIHPDIFMPDRKELHFFDRDYAKGIDFYERYFASWRGQKAVGEATPDYLHGLYTSNDIPSLIHKHIPGAKLIVSLREPVSRAYSHYLNVKAKHAHNLDLSFEQKLQKLKGGAELIKEGFYVDSLKEYRKWFSSQQILVVLYDDLLDDPRGLLRRIYQFLDVDPEFVSKAAQAKINMAVGKKHLARYKSVWLLSRVLSRMNAHGLSERIRLWNAVPQPRVDTATRQELVELYREKNLELQEYLGMDLKHWIGAPDER